MSPSPLCARFTAIYEDHQCPPCNIFLCNALLSNYTLNSFHTIYAKMKIKEVHYYL